MKWFKLIVVLLAPVFITAQTSTIDSLKKAFTKSPSDSLKAKTLVVLTDQYLQLDINEAERTMRQAISISSKIKSGYLLAETMGYMGYIKDAMDDLDSSLFYYNAALVHCKKIKDKEGYPVLLNNMAAVMERKGLMQKSVDLQLEAIKAFEVNGDKKGMSYSYNNIGEVFWSLNQKQTAFKYFKMSQKIAEEIDYTLMSAYSANNIASVYIDSGAYTLANTELFKALILYEKLGDQNGKAKALQNIGSVYGKMSDLPNAIKYMEQAYDIYKKIDHTEGLLRVTYAIGYNYVEFSKPDIGLKWLDQALVLAVKAKNNAKLPNLYRAMSKAYAQKKQFEKAYTYYVMFKNTRDSIYDVETANKFQELEAQYQNEKKTLEIDNLKTKEVLKDVELQKQYAEVKKQNLQKIFFASGFLLMILLAVIVYRSYARKKRDNEIITKQKMEVEHQKKIIEEKQKEVMDSIHYARLIQKAHLPSERYITKVLNKLMNKS